MGNELDKCTICGKYAKDDSHFYHKKMLCNRHYIQMYRHGKILSIEELNKKIKLEDRVCSVCGETNSYHYRIYKNKNSEFDNCVVCEKHYVQLLTHNGNVLDRVKSAKNIERICEECKTKDGDIIYEKSSGKMLCRKHYDQYRTHGYCLKNSIFDKNMVEKIDDKYSYVVLMDRKYNIVGKAKIDNKNIDMVLENRWNLSGWGYAQSKAGLMQNIILKRSAESDIVDHINRDTLDNTEENLRLVNKSENAINSGLRPNNSTGITGVSYSKHLNGYRSYINYNGERIELGYSINKEKAIKNRLRAELLYYGDFAPQRHLFEEYGIKEKEDE